MRLTDFFYIYGIFFGLFFIILGVLTLKFIDGYGENPKYIPTVMFITGGAISLLFILAGIRKIGKKDTIYSYSITSADTP